MKINEKILKDSEFIFDFELCQVRLLKDELDWILLIPKVEGATEIYDLSEEQHLKLIKEVSKISNIMKKNCEFDKLNIASIGNIVSQMHIHIIARKKTDRAWPNTIWGTKSNISFDTSKVDFWKETLKDSN